MSQSDQSGQDRSVRHRLDELRFKIEELVGSVMQKSRNSDGNHSSS